MTRSFALFSSISASAVVTLFAPIGFAIPNPISTPVLTKSDSAEICQAVNGPYQALRGFKANESFFVEFSRDPSAKPLVKENYTFKKEPGGFTQKNAVSAEMFEMMAEPFGGAPKPRAQWKATYEVLFEGRVTVVDDKGQSVGTFDMACNAALVDYK